MLLQIQQVFVEPKEANHGKFYCCDNHPLGYLKPVYTIKLCFCKL